MEPIVTSEPEESRDPADRQKRSTNRRLSIRAVKRSQLTARIGGRVEPTVKKNVTRVIDRAGISFSQFLNNVLKYATRPNMPEHELRFFTSQETHSAAKFLRKDRAS